MDDMLKRGALAYFIDYNKKYDNGEFRGSEARKYDLDAIKTWLKYRDVLTYIDDYQEGDWRTLEIVTSRSRYGTNYIFIDIKNKLWRTRTTPGEFYGCLPKTFNENEFIK